VPAAIDPTTAELERKLANAVADERRRTERNIQAGVLQRLAAMRILVTSVLESAHDSLGRPLDDIARGIDLAMAELSETISSSQPTLISEHGLGGALFESTRGTTVAVAVEDQLRRRHPARAELAVYYACREATQNAAKHAGEHVTVTIRLVDVQRGIDFQIVDDGVGFDPMEAKWGAGLLNIRERTQAAGGTVTIQSTPGAGSIVSGSVPDVLPEPDLAGRDTVHDGAATHSSLRRQIVAETDTERRRIMRDLHDGAQQRLVALRVRIGLATDRAPAASLELATLERLAVDLDHAIAELRDLVRSLLTPSEQVAVAPALRRVTRHWPMEIRVRERNVGRHDRAIEDAVYGCVLETLQDARANPQINKDASAVVSLFEAPEAIHFFVRGRGDGFDLARLSANESAGNIVVRAAVAGGSLSMSAISGGVLIRGSIPIASGA
jgi:signal transduction histidine kinase